MGDFEKVTPEYLIMFLNNAQNFTEGIAKNLAIRKIGVLHILI